MEYSHQRPNFGANLDPKVSKNSGLWSFCLIFSLVSRQYCFTCSLQVLLEVWRIWASEAQLLGPKIGETSHHWSFYQRFSIGFTSFLVYMSIWATLRCVEYQPQRPNFWVILDPEIYHNSGLQPFSQIISAAFALFLFYMLIGGTYRCISMMCPKCPISGTSVKVAAELVRPSGLLFCDALGLHYKLIIFIIS